MSNRLKKWLKFKGLKASVFADRIGVNRATVSHILSNRNKPSIDFIQKLLIVYPDLNANWLITGSGEMNSLNSESEKDIRSINKIVVLYDDNSFDELKS
tara:strand:- start:4 stop:300 length:297 start_codon:yes stop_codon:yes gene_type:complete